MEEYLYEIEPKASARTLPVAVFLDSLKYEFFKVLTSDPVRFHRLFDFTRRGDQRKFVLMVLTESAGHDRKLEKLVKQAVRHHGTFSLYNKAEHTPEDGVSAVEVTVDERNHLAVPDHPDIRLDGDKVEWRFLNVPEGYLPLINFVSYKGPDDDEPKSEFQGPFEKMVLQGDRGVCKRRLGPKGKYWWKVLLVPKGDSNRQLKRLKCAPYIDGQEGGGIELTGEPTG